MTSFWVTDLKELNLLNFCKQSDGSTEDIMNRVTMVVVLGSMVTAIILKKYTPLYVGTLCTAVIAIVYYTKYSVENFPSETPVNYQLRTPTLDNPMMNVNVTDYDEPQKFKNYRRYKEAVYPTPETEKTRKEVKTDFVGSLFQNANGKLWDRHNSQRQFISQPVGGVPSRQNEFAQWLYGKEYVGKAGSIWMRYDVETTPDSMVNTGINSSQPSNAGIKQKYV